MGNIFIQSFLQFWSCEFMLPLSSVFFCFVTHFCCCFALQGSIKFPSSLFTPSQLLLSSSLLHCLLSPLIFNTFNQIIQPPSLPTYLPFSSSALQLFTTFFPVCSSHVFFSYSCFIPSLSSLFPCTLLLPYIISSSPPPHSYFTLLFPPVALVSSVPHLLSPPFFLFTFSSLPSLCSQFYPPLLPWPPSLYLLPHPSLHLS